MIQDKQTKLKEAEKKCEILSSLINDFKDKHPYLSSNQLAHKLGIPQSSLNRIENKATNPSLENILSVLVGTGNEERVQEILSELLPNQKKRFDQIFALNGETPFLDRVSANFATNPDTFVILQMAFTRRGVTVDEVSERFGSFGLEKLNLMLKHDVLFIDEQGVVRANQERVNVTYSDLREIVKLAIDKCFTNEGHISFQTESVSSEGKELILQEVRKAQATIRKIMYNPKYFGNKEIFLGIISDNIVKSSNSDINTKDIQ